MSATRRAAWLVWVGGTLLVVVGVLQRFSMSVTGVDAVDRLGITAAGLGAIAVVQVAVYAALEVPVVLGVNQPGSMIGFDHGAHPSESFRWACLVKYPQWVFGAVHIVRERRRARLRYYNPPRARLHLRVPDGLVGAGYGRAASTRWRRA